MKKTCTRSTCPNGDQKQPATAFHLDSRRPDKLTSWCKTCTSLANRAYMARPDALARSKRRQAVYHATDAYRRRNRERMKARYWADPVHRERIKTEQRERYHLRNPGAKRHG